MDKETFIALAQEAELTCYRVAKSILHRGNDVEDAVQEALLKAYEKRNTLKDRRYFQTWLVRIVINESYGILRKHKKNEALEEKATMTASEGEESYSELYEALKHLPPKIRLTIVLHYIEGYSTKEIKEILKIPQGTVKSRLSKGRKLLKDVLKDEGEYHETRTMAKSLS